MNYRLSLCFFVLLLGGTPGHGQLITENFDGFSLGGANQFAIKNGINSRLDPHASIELNGTARVRDEAIELTWQGAKVTYTELQAFVGFSVRLDTSRDDKYATFKVYDEDGDQLTSEWIGPLTTERTFWSYETTSPRIKSVEFTSSTPVAWFDDFSFSVEPQSTVIPEPASIGWLGFSGALLWLVLRFRKGKRKSVSTE